MLLTLYGNRATGQVTTLRMYLSYLNNTAYVPELSECVTLNFISQAVLFYPGFCDLHSSKNIGVCIHTLLHTVPLVFV